MGWGGKQGRGWKQKSHAMQSHAAEKKKKVQTIVLAMCPAHFRTLHNPVTCTQQYFSSPSSILLLIIPFREGSLTSNKLLLGI